MKPEIIALKQSVDNRGVFTFIDEFDFSDIKRFYFLSNHRPQFIRAWHWHQFESKYVMVVSGSALVAAVKVDDPNNPDPSAEVTTTVISDKNPHILHIPAGYANGAMTLTVDTKLLYFSTSKLADSVNDDIRFEYNFWDVWQVQQR